MVGVLLGFLPPRDGRSIQSMGAQSIIQVGRNSNRAFSDILRLYKYQDIKHEGEVTEDIYPAERKFKLDCETLNIS